MGHSGSVVHAAKLEREHAGCQRFRANDAESLRAGFWFGCPNGLDGPSSLRYPSSPAAMPGRVRRRFAIRRRCAFRRRFGFPSPLRFAGINCRDELPGELPGQVLAVRRRKKGQ